LDQGERFKQFVKGAKATRHHYQGIALAQKKEFAGEEVAEVEQPAIAGIHKAVGMLLKRQIHIQADAVLTASPTVGGLHDAAAGAGHHLEAARHGFHRQLLRQLVGGLLTVGSG
jgi:hypothetical protein